MNKTQLNTIAELLKVSLPDQINFGWIVLKKIKQMQMEAAIATKDAEGMNDTKVRIYCKEPIIQNLVKGPWVQQYYEIWRNEKSITKFSGVRPDGKQQREERKTEGLLLDVDCSSATFEEFCHWIPLFLQFSENIPRMWNKDGPRWNQENIATIEQYVREIFGNDRGTQVNLTTEALQQPEFPMPAGTKQSTSRNLIYFGAPGTGKSHQLNEAVEGKIGEDGKVIQAIENNIGVFVDVDKDKKIVKRRYERVTFYPTYSYAQFVGCYKPVMKPKVGGAAGEEEIAYEFVPGPFLRILVEALNDPENRYCLVIEEINRANAAAVFGDVFQLLDRGEKGQSEYDIAATEDMRRHLDKTLSDIGKETLKNLAGEGNLKIPDNMYIWATMNSADQGVFPMDTAFKRRWAFKYIGINDGVTDDCKKWTIKDYGFLWNEVRTFLNDRLTANGVNEDKLMGPWFVKPENGSVVSLVQFQSKVLMYLWEDAARMCRRKFFADKVKTYPDLVKCWPDAFKGIENWEEIKAGWISPGPGAAMDGAGAPERTAEPQMEAMPAATATGTETQPSE